jgi:hypothetical protein
MNLKEYQNMIYLNLRSVKLLATVTNKRNRGAKGLADDFIERYERGEICRLEFVSKLSYRYKKEGYAREVPSKLRGCAAAQ